MQATPGEAIDKSADQRRSRLELRGLTAVLGAYVAAPLFATIALIAPQISVGGRLTAEDAVEAIQGFCLFWFLFSLVEIVVATPIVIGFERYRWRWLNGSSATFIGFATGCSLATWLFAALNPPSELSDMRLWFDGIAPWGLAGAVGALTFRVIALRSSGDKMLN